MRSKIFLVCKNLVLQYGFIGMASVASLLVLWQSTRVTPLIDYSYQVENAYRMFRGDMPYRDFFLVVAPGTYLIMAMLMHMFDGYNHMVQVYYTMGVSIVTILCTHVMIQSILKKRSMSLILIFPLLFSGQVMYPYPLYDSNVMVSMLIAILLLFYIHSHPKFSPLWYVLAGALAAVPIFMKQNTGGIFFISMSVVCVITMAISKKWRNIHALISFLFGGILVIGLFFFWLVYNTAFDSFIYQTIMFPRYARNPFEALHVIYSQYRLYVSYVFVQWKFLMLLCIAGYFTYVKRISVRVIAGIIMLCISYLLYQFRSVSQLQLYEQFVLFFWCSITLCTIACMSVSQTFRDPLYKYIPIVLLSSVYATFLSHGIIHSSAHMWPFAMMLFTYDYLVLDSIYPSAIWKLLMYTIVTILSFLLMQSVLQNYAMSFISTTGEVQVASIPAIQGLSTPGTWIQDFEAMVRYVQKTIPPNDSVAFLPGEDPFFATTRRKNPLQFTLLHAGVYTLNPNLIIPEILKKNVQWIIAKKEHQTYPWLWISNWEGISYWINQSFDVVVTIGNYDIYKKRNKQSY